MELADRHSDDEEKLSTMRLNVHAALWLCLATLPVWAQETKGVAIGQAIPEIRLQDQSGKLRTFESIRGRKGAMLVFFRSADW